ncbi:MAG: DUF2284 domain-containing protein [Candidatus Caldatribacterium sp.]|nr:DUF2284 domain-containing protein [Candidatus Caldatribacterium sp.]
MDSEGLGKFLASFLSGKVRDFVLLDPREVVTGEWVRLKCQYGCDGFNLCLTCPPYSPKPSETRKILDSYHLAVLLWQPETWQDLRRTCAELERELFLSGYYKAFAMPSGPCELCDPCPRTYPCRHPELARPSMEACGIDVYATVRKLGFPIEVVRSFECRANYYGLVLVE